MLISCDKDDKYIDGNVKTNDRGEIISLPYLWKIPIHADGNWQNYNPSLEDNMVFGENVIIPTTNGPKSRNLTMISSKDGSRIWDWSEWYQPETEGGHFTWNVSFNNSFHWVNGTRRYTIDFESGETIMKDRNSEDRSFYVRVSNIKEDVFLLSDVVDNSYLRSTVFKGNIYNSEYSEYLVLPYSTDSIGVNNRVKGISEVMPYVINGTNYLVIFSTQSYPNWYYDLRLNLYNYDTDEWVYMDVFAAIPKQNNSGPAKIFDDKIYFSAGREILCYNIITGERIWQRDFPHDFTFSGFEISEGIMVANCENQVCYGINPENGVIQWESEGSGTSSNLNNRIMNGVVYFSGGGTPFLYAKNIHTGETLWRLDPFEFEPLDGNWRGDVNLVPGRNGEKGKVIIRSNRYAYCFEAAK